MSIGCHVPGLMCWPAAHTCSVQCPDCQCPSLTHPPRRLHPRRSFPSATNQSSITVTFEAADAGSGLANITCRFRELNPAQSNASATSQDAAESANEWRPCTSPQQYSDLEEGRYGLTLRAADRAGLVKQVRAGWWSCGSRLAAVSTAASPVRLHLVTGFASSGYLQCAS